MNLCIDCFLRIYANLDLCFGVIVYVVLCYAVLYCMLYSVYCTLYTVYCTVYSVECTVYNVQKRARFVNIGV